MRTENSIKNAKVAAIMTVVTVFIGFFSQRVFVHVLGSEYLGLNGLFANILSILSIVELGFSNAIIYNLYKPVSDGDDSKILSLIIFYRKIYRAIAVIIFILGICIMPFIPLFVGNTSISENIYILFLLALFDVFISYILAYRRSILYADQKAYVVNLIHTAYIIVLNVSEIVLLLITGNFIVYLITKIIFRFIENVVVNEYVKKKYPLTRRNKAEKIDDETSKSIKTQMHGLMYHKIASAAVQGTDNMIISAMFGVVYVGLYSNYYMIISAVNEFISQIFLSITGSVGNLLVKENKKKAHDVYKNMLFINSWAYMFCSACILCLIQPFVTIWLGPEYLLSYGVIIIVVLNFYIQGMRKTNARFKEAAGIYYEDRYVPIIESIINLGSSVVLGMIFGIAGVFMGTILSSLVLYVYSYPVFVYKKIFSKKYSEFIYMHIKHFAIAFLTIAITTVLSNICIGFQDSIIIKLVIAAFICLSMPNIIYILIFHKTSEYAFMKDVITGMIRCKKG